MPRVSIAGGTLVGMKQLGWRGWLDPRVYQPAASTGRWLSNVWATAIKLGMAKWPPRRSRGQGVAGPRRRPRRQRSVARATASSPAPRALLTIRVLLALIESPPVSSATRARSQGVVA